MPLPGNGSAPADRPAAGRLGRLVAGLIIAWVTLVIVAYFAVHKPGNPAQLAAVGRILLTMIGLVGTLSLAQALGLLWRRMLPDTRARARWALELGLGLASLSYLMLILGALGGYRPALAWGLAIVSLPFGLPRLASGARAALPRFPGQIPTALLAALVAFLLCLAALRGLAPPTTWDSLVYHLTGPKLYLQSGGLHHNLDLPYLGFPQAGAMLFTWGMLLGGDRLAQWIHLSFALMTVALLPEAMRQLAPRRSWLAAALLISVPTAELLAGVAYVEWLAMYAGLAGWVLLTRVDGGGSGAEQPDNGRLGGPRARALLAAGFLSALAFNVKYTALWLMLGLALVAYLRTRSWKAVAMFAGSALLATLPYLLKNLWLAGNPIYPFFLEGVFWDSHRAWWYSRPGTGLSSLQLLVAPWEATVWGLEGGVYLGHPSYGATLGPLILALVPAGLLALRGAQRPKRLTLVALWAVVGCGYLGWIAQLAYSRLLVQTRLVFPILPLLGLLAATGFEALGELPGWGRSARFIVGGMVGFALALLGLQSALGFAAQSPLGVITGAESQDGYLRSRLGQYALAMESLRQLPPESTVRFLWEPRSYYCPGSLVCEPDALTDRWWHERQHGRDAAAVAAGWQAEGITHVLFYSLGADAIRQAGFDPLTDADWSELQAFLSEYLAPVTALGDAYTLYRWR